MRVCVCACVDMRARVHRERERELFNYINISLSALSRPCKSYTIALDFIPLLTLSTAYYVSVSMDSGGVGARCPRMSD